MKATTRKRYRAIASVLLIALLMTPVVLTWQAWRQARLDNALIVALRDHDDASAITLLNQGADARLSFPIEEVPPPNFWQILRSRFQASRSPKQDGASCLMWALGIDTYSEYDCWKRGECSPPPENPALIRALLAHGADPNLPYHSWSADGEVRTGNTPLLMAIYWRYPTTIQLLLDHHTDPNRADERGFTPLMAVCCDFPGRSHALIAKSQIIENMLLAHGANIRAEDNDEVKRSTAFFWCVVQGHEKMFQTLLDHEPDAKIRQHEIDRALGQAVNSGDKDFVRFLLAHHADVNTEGRNRSVLHSAYTPEFEERDAELIAILRHAGAKD